MSHTPGPWTAELGVAGRLRSDVANVTAGQEILASVSLLYPDDERREEATANAHLIAGAPELLAALVGLVDGCKHWSNQDTDVLVTARAAIAKAKGVASW